MHRSFVILSAMAYFVIIGCSNKPDHLKAITIDGEFTTEVSSFVFARVAVEMVHRLDVDEAEDGVIYSVKLAFDMAPKCTLKVEASGCIDALQRLPIRNVSFNADAFCPGFPQHREGLYIPADDQVTLGYVTLGRADVPGYRIDRSCFNSELELSLTGELLSAGSGKPLSLVNSAFYVKGGFCSDGDYGVASNCGNTIIGSDAIGYDATTTDSSNNPDLVTAADFGDAPRPTISLIINCPDCKTDDTVKFYASKGWEIGQAEYIMFFNKPVFPLQVELEMTEDPAGIPVLWPEGTVSFQAYQDTSPGGSIPEEGEPLSPVVTIEISEQTLNPVELTLDTSGDTIYECTAGEDFCVSLKVSAHCNDEGNNYDIVDCADSDACSEITGLCSEVVCVPSKIACADASSYHMCLASGTGYSDPVVCEEGKVCLNGQCMKEECLGEVMFLVDVSGSMSFHWESVGNSIAAMTGMSPMASFGLATFPDPDSVCGLPDELELGLAADQAPNIATWFEKHVPFGQTPLLEAMIWMNSLLPGLFTTESGALVVLSDGADTCAYPDLTVEEREALIVQELGQWTQTLDQDHGIKTYVIGYQFQGNTGQLVAIAENGGTGKNTFTEAGNEEELTGVLISIAEDLKLCFE